uniref:SBF2 domain-containing protein n=1 Tax=Macrostomum lignano TaxID=282301 RepID=A0A1I8JG29_9PLAT
PQSQQQFGGAAASSYLYSFLKDHPIWQSLQFWSAAFAEEAAVSQDPIALMRGYLVKMRAFELRRDLLVEFVQKQCALLGLPPDQQEALLQAAEHEEQPLQQQQQQQQHR